MSRKTDQECIEYLMRSGIVDDEATKIIEDLKKTRVRLETEVGAGGVKEKDLSAAYIEEQEIEKQNLIHQRQVAKSNAIIHSKLNERIERLTDLGLTIPQAMISLMNGGMQRVAEGRYSAANKRVGFHNLWAGDMLNKLEKLGVLKLLDTKDFSNKTMSEMLSPGITGDALARESAAALSEVIERVRLSLNRAGANIGSQENYAPQSHNQTKMLSKGVDAWTTSIFNKVDWERSFDMLHSTEAEKKAVLEGIFKNITMGMKKGETIDMDTSARRTFNISRRFEAHRVIHFKDAEAALAYHNDFGEGNIKESVATFIDKAAYDLGVMETFGTDPERMITKLMNERIEALHSASFEDALALLPAKTIDRIKKLGTEEEQRTAIQQAVVKEQSNIRNEWNTGKRTGRLYAYYKAVSGELGSPHNPTWAKIMSGVRGMNVLSKLGSATLSAFADTFVKGVNLRYNGENIFSTWKKAFTISFEGLQSAEKLALGRSNGVYIESTLQSMNIRYDAEDVHAGLITRAQNLFFRLTGLTQWNEGQKSAATFELSNRLAENAHLAFDDINMHFRANLQRYGMDKYWGLIPELTTTVNGNKFVLPELSDGLSLKSLDAFLPDAFKANKRPKKDATAWLLARDNAALRVKDNIAADLVGFFADETKFSVIDTDAKSRAAMTFGTSPGTVPGEVVRSMMQFKGFTFSFMQRIIGDQRWQKAGYSKGFKGTAQDPLGVVNYVVVALTFGYIAGMLKDLSQGKEPKDPFKLETIIQAALQSGGAGALGDYVLGVKSTFGSSAASNLIGPTFQNLLAIAPISGLFVRGETEDSGTAVVNLVKSNVPGANIWYARAALDVLFFNAMRDYLSPNGLERSVDRMKEDYNQEYRENFLGTDSTLPELNIWK